jgi:hypothetical protein
MISSSFLWLLACYTYEGVGVHSFTSTPITTTRFETTTALSAECSRRGAFAGIAASLLLPLPAFAAKEDPALKGTKKDPGYEACLSTCMYECTKPKGDEQKSRKECLPECKQKCATTKEQLMIGSPLKKE